MNENNKKRLKATTAAGLAGMLLITGSLAWRDVSQHKTNKFKSKSVTHSMVLLEKFKDKTDWIPGETVEKKVSVRNGQDTDNKDEYTYSDGYVRLQLREFLGKYTSNVKWSDDRYLIDTKGDYVKGINKPEAEAAALVVWPKAKAEDLVIVQVETPTDEANSAPGGGFWYVKTNEKSPNGIYGKFIMISNEPGELVSYVDPAQKVNINDLDKDQEVVTDGKNKPGHNNDNSAASNVEDEDEYYSIHDWKAPNAIKDVIQLNTSSHIKYLSSWKNDSKPGKFWIIDDLSNDGWVYWGERLNHGIEGSIENNSLTHEFLQSVTLKSTADSLVYRLHVNMDAVSYDDLVLWDNIPNEIKDAFEFQNKYEIGSKHNIEGINWTVVAEESGKHLIIADSLKTEQLETIGVSTWLGDDQIKYGGFYPASNRVIKYVNSDLEKADKAFYEKLIVGSTLEEIIQPVIWEEELPSENWENQNDFPTKIDVNGNKKAFSLSVSDINYYGINAEYLKSSSTNNNRSLLLRTPANTYPFVGSVNYYGNIYIQAYTKPGVVRPALWVDFSSY